MTLLLVFLENLRKLLIEFVVSGSAAYKLEPLSLYLIWYYN